MMNNPSLAGQPQPAPPALSSALSPIPVPQADDGRPPRPRLPSGPRRRARFPSFRRFRARADAPRAATAMVIHPDPRRAWRGGALSERHSFHRVAGVVRKLARSSKVKYPPGHPAAHIVC